ncbi:MAG: GGDEF domain-containing protein [Clostridiaceae bacterium]
METDKLVNRELDDEGSNLLIIKRAKSNVARMSTFSRLLIAIESILVVADIVSNTNNVNRSFDFVSYLIMYLLMIFTNIYILLLTKKIRNVENYSQVKKIEILAIVYITFIMLWGSVVTLMDQRLYGKLTVYMVNVIMCSVTYYFDYKKMSIPYCFSFLVLVIGLPFFQKSSDVLIGHYINIVIFMGIAWTASRILYSNYCENIKSNILLSKEIEENILMNRKLQELNFKLEKLSLLDELTQISNRRGVNKYLDFIYDYAIKKKSLTSVAMIDIDNFKKYNDNYGHTIGDEVIRKVAKEIRSKVRESVDFAARYGGEEFLYIAMETSQEEMHSIAEGIRKKIEDLKIEHRYSYVKEYITVSIGISTVKVTAREDIELAIVQADEALYKAKNNGRNCVEKC